MSEKTDKTKYFYGVGRRKRATARAKYYPNANDLEIQINKRGMDQYFSDYCSRFITEALNHIGIKTGSVQFFINGGGSSGQAQAARLAITKALIEFNPELKPIARMHGYVTTDIRIVLPKRAGLRKARKREQWSKR